MEFQDKIAATAWTAARSSSGRRASSSSSPTRTSRTNRNGARAARPSARRAPPPVPASPVSASKRRPTARPAARKRPCPSVPRRGGRSSAASASSSASSPARRRLSVLTPSVRTRRPRAERGLFLCLAGPAPLSPASTIVSLVSLRPGRPRTRDRARSEPPRKQPIMPFTALSRLAAGGRRRRHSCCCPPRAAASDGLPAAPPAAGAAAAPASRSSRSSRSRSSRPPSSSRPAVAALDDRPAGGRRARHADLREVGRPRARRHAARPDQRGASSRPPSRSTEANRAGTEADVQYWRQQVKRLESLVEAGAISQAGVRSGAELAADRRGAAGRARRAGPRGPRRARSTTASTRRRPASIGDIPIRVGDRVTTSTVITTIDDSGGARGLHPGAARPLAGPASLGLPVQLLDADGKVVATNPITFVAPRVDDATQTVLVKSALQRRAAVDARRSSSSARASSGSSEPG